MDVLRFFYHRPPFFSSPQLPSFFVILPCTNTRRRQDTPIRKMRWKKGFLLFSFLVCVFCCFLFFFDTLRVVFLVYSNELRVIKSVFVTFKRLISWNQITVLNTLLYPAVRKNLKTVLCCMYRAFYRELSQNQQMRKIINKYKMYLQPVHMFQQINCHPQGVSIKELHARTASKYTIGGFTVEVFTQLTILKLCNFMHLYI
jgi:hypothetical protein